jgi:prepilin-type N-terminal cleavage/methylation domain-containing protein
MFMQRLQRIREGRDVGFTLIEMLVSMLVMSALGSILLTTVIGTKNSATTTASEQNINEEARLALNRMARELRQADAITSVVNPDGASYNPAAVTAVTFTADFNGDGCIGAATPSPAPTPAPTCEDDTATNPETLTYCWNGSPTAGQLYLIPGTLDGATCNGGTPILTGDVTAFKLSYRSNQYLYDASGDGVTTWSELDAAGSPVGNDDHQLDQPDLSNVDSVVIDLTVASKDHHTQSYETQVDLRNLS